jgi:hypothetical protein
MDRSARNVGLEAARYTDNGIWGEKLLATVDQYLRDDGRRPLYEADTHCQHSSWIGGVRVDRVESSINVRKGTVATVDERALKRMKVNSGELDFDGYGEYNLIKGISGAAKFDGSRFAVAFVLEIAIRALS